MEEGAKNSECFIAIVTDNGQDSYFSREYCRDEIAWAQAAGKTIVVVFPSSGIRYVMHPLWAEVRAEGCSDPGEFMISLREHPDRCMGFVHEHSAVWDSYDGVNAMPRQPAASLPRLEPDGEGCALHGSSHLASTGVLRNLSRSC